MPKRYRKQLGIFSLDVLNKKPKNPAISTSFGMSKIQLRFSCLESVLKLKQLAYCLLLSGLCFDFLKIKRCKINRLPKPKPTHKEIQKKMKKNFTIKTLAAKQIKTICLVQLQFGSLPILKP